MRPSAFERARLVGHHAHTTTRGGTRRAVSVALACLVALGAAACADNDTAQSDTTTTGGQPATSTPHTDPLILHGAAVYAASCASCHGSDLRGTEQGPSHLSIIYEPNHHSDESFRRAIANGVPAHHFNFGDMSPVPGLTDEDVEAVIAFVRAEQLRQGFHS